MRVRRRFFILYTALIHSAKILLYSPAGEYLCYFGFAHSALKLFIYYYVDIHLKNVILALSWGARK